MRLSVPLTVTVVVFGKKEFTPPCKVPVAAIEVEPEYTLAPARVSTPDPCLAKLPFPEIMPTKLVLLASPTVRVPLEPSKIWPPTGNRAVVGLAKELKVAADTPVRSSTAPLRLAIVSAPVMLTLDADEITSRPPPIVTGPERPDSDPESASKPSPDFVKPPDPVMALSTVRSPIA